jgi:GT2 family glycosyltransferase
MSASHANSSPTQPAISVIIASRNRRQMLADCLRSVQETVRAPHEIIVVDDASTDDTAGLVREQFPGVEVLSNPRPASWTVTNNQGIRASRGRHYLLLNDDTKVLPGAIDHCLDFLESHPRAGIVSPRILNGDGSLQPCMRCFPDFGAAVAQALDLHRLLPKNQATRRYYGMDTDYSRDNQAEHVASTCWLLRRECYEEVGPFDERFPPNFSDTEFNLRLERAGWERWVLAGGEIIHYGGATMGTLNLRQLWDFHRGGWLLYGKHYARRYHPVINLVAYGGIAARFGVKAALRITAADRLLQRLPQPHRRRSLPPNPLPKGRGD